MTDEQALPVDAAMYPDVAAHHGLAQALVESARAHGIELGDIDTQGYHRHWTAGIDSNRGTVRVSMGADRRVFSITIATDMHRMASGTTHDLSDAVHVADAWRKGVRLEQLHDRFPFMTFDRVAQAYEDGDAIDVEWDELLASEGSVRMRPLLEAARIHKRLGRLTAAVSHNNLVMFFVDQDDADSEQIRVLLTRDGTYHVTTTWNDSRRTATTIKDVIEAAADLLP
jgi:hypothetical protein